MFQYKSLRRITISFSAILFVLLGGCAHISDPIDIRINKFPYKVYSSEEGLNSLTEMSAGSKRIENSQLYLVSEQKVEMGFNKAGFYPYMSMNTGKEKVKNVDLGANYTFNELLNSVLQEKGFNQFFDVYPKKDGADIILVPYVNLFHVGDGIAYFQMGLAARFTAGQEVVTRYYYLCSNHKNVLRGDSGWFSDDGKIVQRELQMYVPVLMEAIIYDLQTNAVNGVVEGKNQLLGYKDNGIGEIKKAYKITEIGPFEFVVPDVNGSPARRFAYLISQDFVVP